MRLSSPTQLNLNQHVQTILSKSNNIKHLKQLQSFLLTLGHSQTQFYAFKLVRFSLLVLSDFSYARFIFNHLQSPNAHLYTAMITAYASRHDHVSAFSLYRRMIGEGNDEPNNFIYPHVLKSSPEVLVPHGTKLVHARILKSGFGHYAVVQTALVDSYSRSGSDVSSARKVFDEISERSIVSWTAMVSVYTRVGEIYNAVKLFEEMPDRDIPSWNAVIAGCTQNGMIWEAIDVFRKMVVAAKLGVNKPNQVTVVCVLSACGLSGKLQLGKSIHGYVYRNGLSPDMFVSNALVDMYGKCGNLKIAKLVFESSSKKSLTAWNSMINCFALHGQSQNAIDLFEEMKNTDYVKPDDITFIGLLNACTHGGLVEKGHLYFELMVKKYMIEPRIEHYGCLIDLLGRAGQFDKALQMVETMEMEPDEVVWGALLNGSKKHGRSDLAEFAAKKLIEINPENGGYSAMLANLYSELGKWDEVRKVRKMLKENGAYKTPGCSWIEVDNNVHQFYSFDKSHPITDDIYFTLENLIVSD